MLACVNAAFAGHARSSPHVCVGIPWPLIGVKKMKDELERERDETLGGGQLQ